MTLAWLLQADTSTLLSTATEEHLHAVQVAVSTSGNCNHPTMRPSSSTATGSMPAALLCQQHSWLPMPAAGWPTGTGCTAVKEHLHAVRSFVSTSGNCNCLDIHRCNPLAAAGPKHQAASHARPCCKETGRACAAVVPAAQLGAPTRQHTACRAAQQSTLLLSLGRQGTTRITHCTLPATRPPDAAPR